MIYCHVYGEIVPMHVYLSYVIIIYRDPLELDVGKSKYVI